MFFSEAKVWLSFEELWQFMQYWPNPMLGYKFCAVGGQSGAQSDQPNQPQNQPSWDACLSRTMTAAPDVGCR